MNPARPGGGVANVVTVVAFLALGGAVLQRIVVGDEVDQMRVVVAFAVMIFVGELLSLRGALRTRIAPVAAAATSALALSYDVGGSPVDYSATMVIATAALATLCAITVSRAAGRANAPVAEYAVRVVVVILAAVIFREVPFAGGQSLAEQAAEGRIVRWQLALLMIGVLLLAEMVGLVLDAWIRTGTLRPRAWLSLVRSEGRATVPITLAVISSAVVVALGLRSLDVLAVPLFLLPLVVMRIAMRRRQSAEVARRQTIAALSALTDLAGYTPDGHGARVAALSTAVGRRLGLSERQIVRLEGAALLHDIGQVSLSTPVPAGATVELAPLDQQRIADDGADLVLRTQVLDDVAAVIREHPTPYRLVREQAHPLSVEARILKVCNAVDDLAGGDPERGQVAVQRVMLGLGYEYDPEVVDALGAVSSLFGPLPSTVGPERVASVSIVPWSRR